MLPLPPLERAHPGLAFVERHHEGAVERLGDAFEVVGIDAERLAHGLRRAGHPGEQEHAGVVRLTRDELLRDEVHAVAKRGDERDRGVAIERRELRTGHGAVDVADRRPVAPAETAVDPTD